MRRPNTPDFTTDLHENQVFCSTATLLYREYVLEQRVGLVGHVSLATSVINSIVY